MINPTIKNKTPKRETIDTFHGYDARVKISDGYFNSTTNLTADHYPLLAPRKLRGTVMTLTNPQGLIEKDALAYVSNGRLYYNFQPTPVAGLSTGDKQLVSMGAYICIWPDAVYYNTEDSSDYGSMGASHTATGTIRYQMCHMDGTLYQSVAVSDTEPTDRSIDLWVSTGNGGTYYYSYSQAEGAWIELNTVYAKITFPSTGTLPQKFKQYDAVTISGSDYAEVNGEKIIYAIGGSATENDYIVVVYPMTQQEISFTETMVIQREIPALDYVCEAQNRLWGCIYGLDDSGKTINEIHCCALGDFKNWNQYLGISTDSWTGSVGSDGEWTGCVNYLGSPTFFKENHIHVVSISSSGAHSIAETPCRGVQKGSAKSLRIVNETLFYKSRTDVCSYKGGFPTGVSDALGTETYTAAVAGSHGSKLYLSMVNSAGVSELFCLNTSNGIWMREDNLRCSAFASVDDHMYAVAGSALLDLNGSGDPETGPIQWEAVTGIMHYDRPDNKYVTRFDIRAKGSTGSTLQVLCEYNSNGVWLNQGTMRMGSTGSATYPVRPRRCDHMRIKLIGRGDIKIFSLARYSEVGSDVF